MSLPDAPVVSIVVPLFNEEDNFPDLVSRLNDVIRTLPFKAEVVLVDDGSEDRTPFLMSSIVEEESAYTCVVLSRNHGHQLAVSAGLAYASGSEAIFIIDGDLQDPPELLMPFYEKLKEGYDVVYGVRRKRKENALKTFLYWVYYRLLRQVSNSTVQVDSGDFGMISRRVADWMVSMPERSRYLRGMRAWIGLRQYGFEYERQARFAGEPKYTFSRLFKLAYDGLFNFSDFPVKVISRLGLSIIALSMGYSIYILLQRIFFGSVPQGFTTIILFLIMFSGVQLISLGIIGEYVLRIYQQVQGRPLFVVDRVFGGGTQIPRVGGPPRAEVQTLSESEPLKRFIRHPVGDDGRAEPPLPPVLPLQR
jgi:polyisoprenyl-phosphate glycosyltransferase